MTETDFHPATKLAGRLRLALFGPAGSGKTYSALRIATGLAGEGGKIAVIDTERGSASLYADQFRFDVLELADRRTEGYVAALAKAAEYDIVIIDGLSHAWQELLEEVDRAAPQFGGNKWAAWSKATPKQKRFVEALLTHPAHVIATMRSDTVWEQQRDERTGKVGPVRIGLKPEQRKGIEYEFSLVMQISVQHAGNVIKDRTGKFQDAVIDCPDEAFGRDLAEWLATGAPAPPAAAKNPVDKALGEIGEQLAGPDLTRLGGLIEEHGLTEQQQAAWCTHYGVEQLGQLTQEQVDRIVVKIEKKGAY